jgi:hypothetical protein
MFYFLFSAFFGDSGLARRQLRLQLDGRVVSVGKDLIFN